MSRRTLRRVCLAVAAAGAVGACVLLAVGGYEFTVVGVTIRGHRIDRLVWIAAIAAVGYVAAGGRIWPTPARRTKLAAVWRRSAGSVALLARAAEERVVALHHTTAVVLAVAVLGATVTLGSRAAGGSDSYGYLSQAHLWLSGELKQPLPRLTDIPSAFDRRAFQPLGYTTVPGDPDLKPVYSPGLPMLMALAMLIGGACASFVVVPVAASVAVYGTYRLGRGLVSGWGGVVAAWLLASSPTFVFSALQPMSDVPALAAWTSAFVLALRPTVAAAAGAGLCSGLAILIRVNHAPMILALIVLYAMRALDAPDRPGLRRWSPLAGCLMGLAPGVVIVGVLNAHLHGSPIRSGYGTGETWFAVDHVLPNLWNYARWLTATETPIVWGGVVALALPFARWWSGAGAHRMVAALRLFVFLLGAEYCLYLVFDAWWYLRFFLPAFPAIFVGLAAVGGHLLCRLPRVAARSIVASFLVLTCAMAYGANYYEFDLRWRQSVYPVAGRAVETLTPPGSVILAVQHSGSVRYYAGRMTIRFDHLDRQGLDETVAWFAERGAHPYALLERFEVEDWQRRFGATERLGRLGLRPLATFPRNPGLVFYDLLADGPESAHVIEPVESDDDCRPPAPALSFFLGR